MPTNRTRIKRAVRSRVTDEARAIYAEALKLREVHEGYLRSATCGNATDGQHSAECDRYTELRRELGRMVGVKFWEHSPLEVDSEDPPAYIRNNPLQFGYWVKAWALRCELDRQQTSAN